MPTINVGPGFDQGLQDIADTLGKSRKVLVVTGAGISTNCGIPDFRSENGLYSLIQAHYDAALQNPPWENTDDFDIDDRPKKKRRVTERWYYEIVPSTGPTVDNANDQSPEEQQTGSQGSKSASQSTTGRSTPVASRCLDSSPLSSPRSITPQLPSEDFEFEDSPTDPHELRSSPPPLTLPPRPRSLRSQSSTPSSGFATDDTSREALSQSQSTAPSSTSPPEETLTSTEPEQHSRSGSSTPSSESFDTPKDAPQASQSTSRPSLPNLKGRDLFDSMIWADPFTTSIFYMFISSLRQKIQDDVTTTTPTHKFIRTLRDGGRLVRNYTQNIDSLEEREGLCADLSLGPGNRSRFQSKTRREPRPSAIDRTSPHSGGVEVVQLHGSLGGLRCGICAKPHSWDLAEYRSATLAGTAPDCPACAAYNAKRTRGGRRGLAVGRLRPDIVLYGEEHPHANLVAPLITHDLSLGPDFLLIMGTSLKVHGLKVMVKEFAKAVHLKGGKVIFVNRTKPPESTWGEFIDYWVEWDCDEWVLDLKKRNGDIWLPQGSQDESKMRRESSGEARAATKKAPRPQAVRDDKLSGVYHTFKILDLLGQLKDADGVQASRPIYWEKQPVKTFVAPVKLESRKQTRKSLPAPKTSSKTRDASKAGKAGKAKKRKSCPTTSQDQNLNSSFAEEIWRNLRKLAPGLDPNPPESGRIALSELNANFVFPTFKTTFPPTINHYPNLKGLGPLKNINLITHPPHGADVPIHTPKSNLRLAVDIPKPEMMPRPVTHSYGTRARGKSLADSTIVVDDSAHPRLSLPSLESWSPTEDTIVVERKHSIDDTIHIEETIVVATPPTPTTPPTHSSSPLDATFYPDVPLPSIATPPAEGEKPLSPPTNESMTPDMQRIKRQSSLDAILSREGSDASSKYYDAMEH